MCHHKIGILHPCVLKEKNKQQPKKASVSERTGTGLTRVGLKPNYSGSLALVKLN